VTIRIFQHYWQLPLALLAILEGTIFLAAMHYTAPFTLSGPVPPSQHPAPWVPHSLLFAGIMFVSMAAMGLYNSRQRARLAGLLSRVAASMLGGAMVIAVIVYLLPVLRIGRGALLLSTLVSFGAVAVVRIAFDLIVDEAVFKRRVLVYGAGRRAASIVRLRRRSDRRGFLIVGYVMADGDDLSALRDHERLVRSDQDLLSYCQAQRIDEIVVAMDDRRRRFPMDQLLECRLEGFEISELVTFLERETGKVRLDILNPSWMIFAEGFRQGRAHGIFERLFDVVASFVMLAATAPVMLLTAAAIKISDGWRAPIFYRQIRVGQYGKPFKLLKFRSMRADAERDGAQWAQKNDSRVTRVGSFIRLTRIAHHTKAIVHPVEQVVDRIDAACDRGVEPALAQEIDGGHYSREARGLLLTDRRVRAAQLELEAHQAGSGISNGAVEQQRRRIRWSAIEECRQVLRRRSAASVIRAENDTRAIVGSGPDGVLRLRRRLLRDHQGQGPGVVHATQLHRRNPLRGLESGYACRQHRAAPLRFEPRVE